MVLKQDRRIVCYASKSLSKEQRAPHADRNSATHPQGALVRCLSPRRMSSSSGSICVGRRFQSRKRESDESDSWSLRRRFVFFDGIKGVQLLAQSQPGLRCPVSWKAAPRRRRLSDETGHSNRPRATTSSSRCTSSLLFSTAQSCLTRCNSTRHTSKAVPASPAIQNTADSLPASFSFSRERSIRQPQQKMKPVNRPR